MTEAVLFDFNGVLVDDESQHCEVLQRVLADERITLAREQYYAEYLGLDDRTGFVYAYRNAQRTLTTEMLKHLVTKKSQLYLELIRRSSISSSFGNRCAWCAAHRSSCATRRDDTAWESCLARCEARSITCSAKQSSPVTLRSSLPRTMSPAASPTPRRTSRRTRR